MARLVYNNFTAPPANAPTECKEIFSVWDAENRDKFCALPKGCAKLSDAPNCYCTSCTAGEGYVNDAEVVRIV